jgi:hypothetical protein
MKRGIKDLNSLLKHMQPIIHDKEYVFCTLLKQPKNIKPLMIFREKEGITLIIDKETAEKENIPYDNVWCCITLNVHSDLAAVGFLARITEKLAAAGISVNVVSAYYHDHLFVQKKDAEKAMKILKQLSKEFAHT